MNKIMEKYEKDQIKRLTSKKNIPTFRPGDTIKVNLKIVEGDRSRLQAFEGVCIARSNNGLNSSFTIRKLSHGEGVERVFPLFSPLIDTIEVIRKGDVRRAKLYYLRSRKGRSARIVDSNRGEEKDQYSMSTSNDNVAETIQKDIEETVEDGKDKIEEKKTEAEKTIIKESSDKTNEKSISEESQSTLEKSESTASEAGKTQDDTKP